MAQTDPTPTSHAEASAKVHRALRDGVRGEELFKAIYDAYAFGVRSGEAKELRREAKRLGSLANPSQPTLGKREEISRWEELLAVAENAASKYGIDRTVSDLLSSPEKPSSWPWCSTFKYNKMATRRLSGLIFDIEWELGEHYARIGRQEADARLARVKSDLLWRALSYAGGGILPPLWDELREKPSWTCLPPRPLSSNAVKYENRKQVHEPFRNQIIACVKYVACDMGIDWKTQRTQELYDRVRKWHLKVHGHLIKKYRPDWKGGIAEKIILKYGRDHIKDDG